MKQFIFKDVELVNSRLLYTELARIYGVGQNRAKYLCYLLGISGFSRVEDINYYYFELISYLLKIYYGTDIFLLRMEDNKLRNFLSFKSYKAIRFSAGLPVRGQRTHTNSRTSKVLRSNFKYR